MWEMMMCTHYMSNYYLYDNLYNNEQIEQNDETNKDVYILHIKRYAISIYSELGR
jgi:hypothetical protein